MKSYSTVIFDLDGTLLNTLEDLTNATNQALRECGYPEHTMEDVKGFVGNGIGMLIRRQLPPDAMQTRRPTKWRFRRSNGIIFSTITTPPRPIRAFPS